MIQTLGYALSKTALRAEAQAHEHGRKVQCDPSMFSATGGQVVESGVLEREGGVAAQKSGASVWRIVQSIGVL